MLFDYDVTSPESILAYAKELEGQSFNNILRRYYAYYNNLNEFESIDNSNTNAKGQLGNFLEEYYFGYKPNSDQEADFSEAGVELKMTCIDTRKDGSFSAGERLSITNISFESPIEPDFYKSHLWNKIQLILLIHYLRDKTIPRMQNKILFSNLFSPPEEDLRIIKQDYDYINNKISSGLAHELSEGDTMYLGACTKGATAKKSMRPQYYGTHELAKKRNFCFKRSYMDYILNTYILKHKVPCETLIKNVSRLQHQSFEEILLNQFNGFLGKTDYQLSEMCCIEYTCNKAQWHSITNKILGLHNMAEEFLKANIAIKTVRLEENMKNKESIPLPTFKFNDLAKENWENSELFDYVSTQKFLFVVFKRIGKYYELYKVKLWNMPYTDIDGPVREGWEKIKNAVVHGIDFRITPNGTITNNLPKKSDNPVIHIRPHSQKSAYKLKNGYTNGNLTRDANPLPDGQWMTTQSFWLNNDYILKQLDI